MWLEIKLKAFMWHNMIAPIISDLITYLLIWLRDWARYAKLHTIKTFKA